MRSAESVPNTSRVPTKFGIDLLHLTSAIEIRIERIRECGEPGWPWPPASATEVLRSFRLLARSYISARAKSRVASPPRNPPEIGPGHLVWHRPDFASRRPWRLGY